MKKILALFCAVLMATSLITMVSAEPVNNFTPNLQSYLFQGGTHNFYDVAATADGANSISLSGKGSIGKNENGTFGVGAKYNGPVSLIRKEFSFTLDKDIVPAVNDNNAEHWFRLYFTNEDDFLVEGATSGTIKGLFLQIQYYSTGLFNITMFKYDDTAATKLSVVSNAGIAYTKGTPIKFQFIKNGTKYNLAVDGVVKYSDIDLSAILPDGNAYFTSLAAPGPGYVVNGTDSDTFGYTIGVENTPVAQINSFTPCLQSYLAQNDTDNFYDVTATALGTDSIKLLGKGSIGKNAIDTFGVGAKYSSPVSLTEKQFSFTLDKDIIPAANDNNALHWFRLYFTNENDYLIEGGTSGTIKGLFIQIQYYSAGLFNITLFKYDDTIETKLAVISNAGIPYTVGTPINFTFVKAGTKYSLAVDGVEKYFDIDLSTLLPDGTAYFSALAAPGPGYVVNGTDSDTFGYTVGLGVPTVVSSSDSESAISESTDSDTTSSKEETNTPNTSDNIFAIIFATLIAFASVTTLVISRKKSVI